MASIGGVSCSFVRGSASPLKTQLAVWRVPGLNGYGAMDVGSGDAPFQFTAVKYGSLSTVESWATQIALLQGQVISITDDHGTVHPNLLLVGVSPPARTAESGNGGVRGEIMVQGVATA